MLDSLVAHLVDEGITTVFGIPGGLLYPFFDRIEKDSRFSFYVSRHEAGAAFMADGYARVTGRPAVAAATAGPGATNLITGLGVAMSDGVPMVVLTGQASTAHLGKGASQETWAEDIDIVQMLRPVSKYSAMVTSAEHLPRHFRRAVRRAVSGRPGPVHLNVPVDLWKEPVNDSWSAPASYRPIVRSVDIGAVRAAADLLLSARRPMLLVGSGAAAVSSREHLQQFVETLGCPAATTPRGKGVFPEDHPQSLGVFGFAGHASARQALLAEDTDVLLTVGAALNETTTLNWNPALTQGKKLIQLDIDIDRIGRNYPVDVALVGDAEAILPSLTRELRQRQQEQSGTSLVHLPRTAPLAEDKSPDCLAPNESRDSLNEPRPARIAVTRPNPAPAPVSSKPTPDFDDEDLRISDAVPLTPQRWRADLSEILPADAIIVSDIGAHMLFNIHHLRIGAKQQFILNLNFGSMGHGTAAPIGAALGSDGRPVIAIVGDACFTMNGMEVLTAREYDIPVVWIVENNQQHGVTWHASRILSSGKPLHSIVYEKCLNIADIAQAMGLKSWRVEKPGEMQNALQAALSSAEPALIEVLVDPDISPPVGGRVETVAGFKNE
ncbi:thiamine pyrophosphate-binding protein [Streptomyces sp. NPDC052013]|uniref:thiamine pyrophosphate-binding protein n=1 Tax=Streptomyces sp. NPDC052013 TaxID=3365679 RepID=UPI0037D1F0FD